MEISPRLRAAALLGLALLFPLIANLGAYRGYFDSDDFGSINWARYVPFKQYFTALPKFQFEDGRPLGYLYYGVLVRTAGLHFPAWIAVLQIIGIINVALLWRVLRSLRFGDVEAAIACLFFSANSALLDGWWRPAFVYDVLATTFALAALLAYIHGRWGVSFVACCLSMRSKEIGIVVPAVLLCYEMIIGERNWKRLVPFFIPATIYGASGLWYSSHAPRTPYTIRPDLIWRTMRFYSSQLVGIRFGSFGLVLLLFVVREKRLYFAFGALLCELGIYFLLPGRMLPIYLYLATTAAAIAIALLIERYQRATVIVLLVWVGWQFAITQKNGHGMIDNAKERRQYAAAVRAAPSARTYVYADEPSSFIDFGAEYAIRVLRSADPVYRLDDPALPPDKPMTLLVWNSRLRTMQAVDFQADRASYFPLASPIPKWQSDWENDLDGYRPLLKEADVKMYRPAAATTYEIKACGSPGASLRAWTDGQELSTLTFTAQECLTTSTRLSTRGAAVIINNLIPSGNIKVGDFGFK